MIKNHQMQGAPQLIIAGFTLIEVLVSVSIVATALIGLAGLHLANAKLSHDTLVRTTANVLAMDMADRIRANYTAAKLGQNSPYNNANGTQVGHPNCLGKNQQGESITTQCNAREMAEQDYYEWSNQLARANATDWHGAIAAQLPQGAGIVCIDSTPEDGTPEAPACDNVLLTPEVLVYAIKIWWVESKDKDQSEQLHQFVMNVAL